jgi:SagB-type dehydrogenase family enzyme
MKKIIAFAGVLGYFISLAVFSLALCMPQEARGEGMKEVKLPQPRLKGTVSVEEAIQKRRSVRSYASKDISLQDVSQLLWACQGITNERRGLRAVPSAGALYPLEIYVAKKDGIFRYVPDGHKLETVSDKDVKAELSEASLGQPYVAQAAIDIVICAVYERITSKYGQRGVMYTDMEAGHAAQNVFLQAVALGLDSVPIGAFDERTVAKILGVPQDRRPIYILPVGYKK